MEQNTISQELDKRFLEMEEKLDSIEKKLTEVINALTGNPLLKSDGITSKIEALEQKVKNLEAEQVKNDLFRNRVYWTIGTIGGISMFLGVVFKYMFDLYMAGK